MIPMIDADTSAFNEFMEGLRMPRKTEAEKAARQAKMQAGLKTAVEVPLNTMRLGDAAWDTMVEVARHGNPASKSDIQVGARALETGIWGAFQNVLINLADIVDEEFKAQKRQAAEAMHKRATEKCAEVLGILEGSG